MTDNNIDVNIVPVKNGAKRVVVSYYHYSRKDKNHMSSQTDYVRETKNEEMFKYFEARRTKVFYSQIRAMCRFYGKKNVRKYKKLLWVIIHHFTSKMKNDIHLYEASYRVSPIPSTGCSKVRSPDSFTKNVFDFTHLTFSRWNLISKTSFAQPSCPKRGTM